MQLSKQAVPTRAMNAVSAGTGDTQSGSIVDLEGNDGVLFIALLGDNADTAVVTLQAQGADVNDTGEMATYAGATSTTLTATSGDNKLVVLDVYRPGNRYVRPQVVRATANVVIDGVIAIPYSGRNVPPTVDTTVLKHETLVSPAFA